MSNHSQQHLTTLVAVMSGVLGSVFQSELFAKIIATVLCTAIAWGTTEICKYIKNKYFNKQNK